MLPQNLARLFPLPIVLALVASGCAVSVGGDPDDIGNDPPLADSRELLDGAPKGDEVPREYNDKADAVLPRRHTALRDLQSPVRNQARRGVCSIFSTIALMEHLYIVEGTITEPDFSEQYLQWSAKFEVGSFPRSSGSNDTSNLRAISQFWIPEEHVWPYEPDQWNEFDDPECNGDDDQPTFCYTNGHPTDEMLAAPKFHLPPSRFLSTRDIKAHIFHQGLAVVGGMDFFYQSWNHRRSELPTNSDNWDQGIVLYPNSEDRRISLENRAGHAILILGWDDDMEVPIRDENGDLVTGDDGAPVVERGFYLFKNSWGTASFGIRNEFGAGYGWISQRYINEIASIRVAGLPTVERPAEICDNGIDDSRNGLVDCDDPACAEDPACLPDDLLVFTGSGGAIPDNTPIGFTSVIDIDVTATIADLVVDVDITHTFRGDLRVTLQRGGQSVVLHNRTGGGAHNLVQSYEVGEFDGAELRGEWTLLVQDLAAIDTGTLNSWTIRAEVTP
jgi:hypothetical protein